MEIKPRDIASASSQKAEDRLKIEKESSRSLPDDRDIRNSWDSKLSCLKTTSVVAFEVKVTGRSRRSRRWGSRSLEDREGRVIGGRGGPGVTGGHRGRVVGGQGHGGSLGWHG